MLMNEWITSAAAVASLVTALAALATILEMKRQRRGTYRPDFVLLRSSVYAHRHGSGRITVSNSQDTPQLGDFGGLAIRAANVGLGSCKHLVLEWRYDILEFSRVIKECDTEEVFGITYDKPNSEYQREL